MLEPNGIAAAQVAVLVNGRDPLSVAVGNDYVERRHIPTANLITLDFERSAVMTAASFRTARALLVQKLPEGIEALVLAWTQPYRVECMSAVAAFAIDYQPDKYCGSRTACQTTAEVQTFDSPSHKPFEDFGIRPTMMLPGTTLCAAETLIDRGLASDDTFPGGDVCLVTTRDSDRNKRNAAFERTALLWSGAGLTVIATPSTLKDTANILGYQTGFARVPFITTNTYRPGAVADHLTSYGGQIPESLQMSALEWLTAGATASYGTVIEPCSFTEKFPDAATLWSHYFRGEPIIEAYWKSVRMPGEGNFVGEPLARPFGTQTQTWDGQRLTLSTTALIPGAQYAIEAGATESGPWLEQQAGITIDRPRRTTMEISAPDAGFYRLVRR